MMPFCVNTQQHEQIRVFSHCKIINIDDRGYGIVNIKVKTKLCDVKTLTMVGKHNCKKLVKKFREGDTVNVVSEGGVIRKFTKGIDLEV